MVTVLYLLLLNFSNFDLYSIEIYYLNSIPFSINRASNFINISSALKLATNVAISLLSIRYMQSAIDEVSLWYDKNRLPLNSTKSDAIQIVRRG